jgi:hypothetical protein
MVWNAAGSHREPQGRVLLDLPDFIIADLLRFGTSSSEEIEGLFEKSDVPSGANTARD